MFYRRMKREGKSLREMLRSSDFRGRSVEIAPDAHVDPTACITDSVVAPGARIGPGVRLDMCVVLAGAVVMDRGPHRRCVIAPNGRLDASATTERSHG